MAYCELNLAEHFGEPAPRVPKHENVRHPTKEPVEEWKEVKARLKSLHTELDKKHRMEGLNSCLRTVI